MMGYKEDGNWSVEAKFTSMNRPWRHPPKDDESGAGAAGTHVRNTMKNLQIYMMQGGGTTTPHLPQDAHIMGTVNQQLNTHTEKHWKDWKVHHKWYLTE